MTCSSPTSTGVVSDEDLTEIGESARFPRGQLLQRHPAAPATPRGGRRGEYPGTRRGRSWPTRCPGATTMGWPITPDGLAGILLRITHDYPSAPPLVVTENGSAWIDPPEALAVDGPVPDPQRVDYLRAHLRALARPPPRAPTSAGYFAWSLMDNFEWATGYTQRFGLVRVDYARSNAGRDELRHLPRHHRGDRPPTPS